MNQAPSNRRLENEFKKLKESYPTCTVSDNKIAIKSKNDRLISFVIPKEYPFRYPQILIDNKPASCRKMDSILTLRFNHEFHTCPCCIFDLRQSWSPMITLEQLVKKVIQFENDWLHVAYQHVKDIFHKLPDELLLQIAQYL